MLDQRQLQRAWPGTKLANRQRRDRLERGTEPVESRRVQMSRARANELESQRVNPWACSEFVGCDSRKPFEERRRKVVDDIASGGRNDMEVIEQHLGGGRCRFATTRILGKCDINRAERAPVFLESPEMRAAAASRPALDREKYGKA